MMGQNEYGYFYLERRKFTRFHRSVGVSLSLKTGIRPKPKVIALKMVGSLKPLTISWSRPGGGGTSFLPTGPRSVEVCPWHMAQLISKSVFPCDSDASVGATGFLSSDSC